MNATTAILIKTLTPIVQKLAESGKIDGVIQAVKDEQVKQLELTDNETVEIMITTENDGKEYVSLVVLYNNSTIKTIKEVLRSMPVGELIVELLKKL